PADARINGVGALFPRRDQATRRPLVVDGGHRAARDHDVDMTKTARRNAVEISAARNRTARDRRSVARVVRPYFRLALGSLVCWRTHAPKQLLFGQSHHLHPPSI